MKNNKKNKGVDPLLNKIPRLSSPIVEMKAHYDVVVVGSGYGGSISASRLARMGFRVCLLERGREIMPGDFPSKPMDVVKDTQCNLKRTHTGSRSALFHVHENDAITTIVGMGLGGTSLINANVAKRSDRRVFDDPIWPQQFRNDVETELERGYQRAEQMLGSNTYPERRPMPPKMAALKQSAEAMGAPFIPLPINVTFDEQTNCAGVTQPACTMCGNCMTGCNYGAKNTTHMNYLPDAHKHGAEIYCEVDVRYVERKNGRWLVHYHPLNIGIERFGEMTQWTTANIVVLSAGTFGSTDILMRSAKHGLRLSKKLGENFSGNGDIGGIAYNCDETVGSIGSTPEWEHVTGEVGPSILSAIDVRACGEAADDVEKGIIVEDGTFPSPLINGWLPRRVMAALMALSASRVAKMFFGLSRDTDTGDELEEGGRTLQSLIKGAYYGATKNSQLYLGMAHDKADGKLYQEDDRMRVSWPKLAEQPFINQANVLFGKATAVLGGTIVKNPFQFWLLDFGRINRKLFTVHPLGGCIMGEDATTGVVNHKGQVFNGISGEEVHAGLYVADGSVIPRSIGINPLLTISAITERMAAYMAVDFGRQIDYRYKTDCSPPPVRQDSQPLQMSEAMKGYFAAGANNHEQGFNDGRLIGSKLCFQVTILTDNVDTVLTDPNRHCVGRFTGTVVAPELSKDPLMVTDGHIKPGSAEHNPCLEYMMQMHDRDGRPYYLHGVKMKQRRKMGWLGRPFSDASVLQITIYDGNNISEPVLGRGMIKSKLRDLIPQLRSVKSTKSKRTEGVAQRIRAIGKASQIFF